MGGKPNPITITMAADNSLTSVPEVVFSASAHPVRAVTVFSAPQPGIAQVTRAFDITLEAGANYLRVRNLPATLDVSSVQVTVGNASEDNLAQEEVRVVDIACKLTEDADAKEDACQREEEEGRLQRKLKGKLASLEGTRDLYDHAVVTLVRYSGTLGAKAKAPKDASDPETVGDRAKQGGASIEQLDAYLDRLLSRGPDAISASKAIDEEIAEVAEEIRKESRAAENRKKLPKLPARMDALLVAKKAGRVEVILTYMVSNASWTPTYELRASSLSSSGSGDKGKNIGDGLPSPRLTLRYSASVKQETGEDWNQARVSVSTAAPGRWSNVPLVRRMQVLPGPGVVSSTGTSMFFPMQQRPQAPSGGLFGSGFSQVQQQQSQQLPGSTQGFGAFGSTQTYGDFGSTQPAFGGASLFGSSMAQQPPPPQALPAPGSDEEKEWTAVQGDDASSSETGENSDSQWSTTQTVVRSSAVASTFRVEHTCSIPTGTTPHTIAIATIELDASIGYIVIPRTVPEAFLECKVTNKSDYMLLPGPMRVFLDDSLVSNTNIKVVGHGESFYCTFGPTPTLRVTLTRPPREVIQADRAVNAYIPNRTIYRVRTRIHNTSNTAVIRGIRVRDAAPVPIAGSALDKQLSLAVLKPAALQELAQKAEPGKAQQFQEVEIKNAGKGVRVQVRWDKETGPKDGRYEWLVDIGANETVELEAEYEVSASANAQWHLSEWNVS